MDAPIAAPGLRQGFHLEADRGLINDPNGLCHFGGRFHVFVQWNRFAKDHSYKEWGHFTSADLVEWDFEGSALLPDQDYDRDGVYSGSACEAGGLLHLYYTGNRREGSARTSAQCLAVSRDGRTFVKRGPVLRTPPGFTSHFRDPKVWRDGEAFRMVIGAQTVDGDGVVAGYRSEDGVTWTGPALLGRSSRAQMIECPDLFRSGDETVLVYGLQYRDGRTDAVLGARAVHRVLPSPPRWSEEPIDLDLDAIDVDAGFDFYAPQTFSAPDGRRLMIAWMSRLDAEQELVLARAAPRLHCLTLPREVDVRSGKLRQRPARELRGLLGEEIVLGARPAGAVEPGRRRAGIRLPGRTFHVEIRRPDGPLRIELNDGEILVDYHSSSGVLTMRRRNWAMGGLDERACRIGGLERLELWADVSSLELFANDGEAAMSARIMPGSSSGSVLVDCDDAGADLVVRTIRTTTQNPNS